MATLTIRMPEAKAERLKALAESRNISVNKLMEEMATHAIVAFDVETRFRARAARGSRERGLALLDELDAYYGGSPPDPMGGGLPAPRYSLHERPQAPYQPMPPAPPKKRKP